MLDLIKITYCNGQGSWKGRLRFRPYKVEDPFNLIWIMPA